MTRTQRIWPKTCESQLLRIEILFILEKTGLEPNRDALVKEFHHAFMHENALNPMTFPSLR